VRTAGATRAIRRTPALSRLPSPPAHGSISSPRVKPSKENSFLTVGMFGDTVASEGCWEQKSLCSVDLATFSRAAGLAARFTEADVDQAAGKGFSCSKDGVTAPTGKICF